MHTARAKKIICDTTDDSAYRCRVWDSYWRFSSILGLRCAYVVACPGLQHTVEGPARKKSFTLYMARGLSFVTET
jgi:hypothetical protein